MTRVVSTGPLRRTQQSDQGAARLQDAVDQALKDIQAAVDGLEPRLRPTPVKTTGYRASASDLVLFDPSNGPFTIVAPGSPDPGDSFAVKNVSSDETRTLLDGNGNNIEDPLATFSLASTVAVSGSGFGAQWTFAKGVGWLHLDHLTGSRSPSIVATVEVIPSPTNASGTVETLVGSVFLPSGTFTQAAALLGTQHASDTATLRLRSFNTDGIMLTMTHGGNLTSVTSTGSVVIPASGYYDLSLANSAVDGNAICEAFRLLGTATSATSGVPSGEGGADPSGSYVLVANTGSLPNGRALAAGTGITLADGGAGGSITVGFTDSVVATVSGTTFKGTVYTQALNVTGNLSASGDVHCTNIFMGDSPLGGINATITGSAAISIQNNSGQTISIGTIGTTSVTTSRSGQPLVSNGGFQSTVNQTNQFNGPTALQQSMFLAGVISPTAFTGSGVVANYNPTNLGISIVVRQDSLAPAVSVSGIIPPTFGFTNNRVLYFLNVSTGSTYTFLHEDSASSAANRFLLPGSGSVAVRPFGGVALWYDGTSTRWRALGVQ